jgi:hypothetical protein
MVLERLGTLFGKAASITLIQPLDESKQFVSHVLISYIVTRILKPMNI